MPLTVQGHPALPGNAHAVDVDASTEKARVGRVAPPQLLRAGNEIGPCLQPAPGATGGDRAVGLRHRPAVPDRERRGWALRSSTACERTAKLGGATQPQRAVYAETAALNDTRDSNELAVKAGRVDLILGSNNRERSPYGTTFNDVSATVAPAEVHELAGQGHMVHLEAPSALAALLNQLRSANGVPRSGD